MHFLQISIFYSDSKISVVDVDHVTCILALDLIYVVNIVNGSSSNIQGCIDEYIQGIQCGDRLRTGLLWEDDDNFCEL